jgi:hypothetical protein
MARKVGTFYRGIPKDTRSALSKTSRLSSHGALSYLQKRKIPKAITLTKLRDVSKQFSRKHKVKVKVTGDRHIFSKQHGAYDIKHLATHHCDGLAVGEDIYLHPVLQYYSEDHLRDVLHHEFDHVKVARKQHALWWKQGFRPHHQRSDGVWVWYRKRTP